MSNARPTPELLRRLLEYDRETGTLIWKSRAGQCSIRWNSLHAGKVAGTVKPDGNIAIKILDRNQLAHRIIWAMVHDTWPECVVHRNGDFGDNRLTNLRAATRAIVQRNLGLFRTNTSGVKGVFWSKVRNMWVASIKIDDISIYLGAFDRKEEAAKARRSAERKRDRL